MARQPSGIEAVVASRRGGMPTKEELQQRTAALSQRRAQQDEGSSITQKVAEAHSVMPEISDLSLEDLRRRCEELLEAGGGSQVPQRDKPPKVSARSSVQSSMRPSNGGKLLHGTFDEDESSASFAEALQAWRGRGDDASDGMPSVHGTSSAHDVGC